MNALQKAKYVFALSKGFISPYTFSLVFMVLLGLLNGIAGSIGIGLVIPIFSLFSDTVVEETDFITRNVERFFSLFHIPLTPIFLVAFIVFLFVIKALAQFTAKYHTEKLTARFEKDLRRSSFEKTLQARWLYLLEQKTGYLERVLLFDITQVAGLFNQVSTGILVITSFITYAFVAFKISASITFITVAFGGLLFLFFKPLFFKTRKISEEMGSTYKLVAHHVGQNIIGSRIVKATGTEDKVIQQGTRFFERLREARVAMGWYTYALGQSIEPIGVAFIAVLFILMYRSPGFNIASFGVVVYLIQKIFSFIQSAQSQMQGLSNLIPYMESVTEYRREATRNKEENAGNEAFRFHTSLEFRNVAFSYRRSGKVLENLNFSIRKGQIVGMVGPSGSGKTTVVDLLLRLFQPQDGQILLDGKDIATIDTREWRKNIGYVPQDIFLLNDTIENNILFYDDTIPQNKIIEATKMANIYDFVQTLPGKFQTITGERGLELSGGQRQRIVLARALARNPKILILDEATSAIDSESEALIQKAIYSLRGKVTTIIIAHRLSTIAGTDYLIVLDKGTIVEQGVPAALLGNQESHFYRIYHAAR